MDFHIPGLASPKDTHLFEGMTLKALITSYPALGEVTEVEDGKARFSVLLETESARAGDKWEVVLWYSSEGREWQELLLSLEKDDDTPYDFQQLETARDLRRVHFGANLELTSTTTFTIKFRNHPESSWNWVKEHQGLFDGVIIPKAEESQLDGTGSFIDIFTELNASFEVTECSSGIQATRVWSVTRSIAPAEGDKSTFETIKIGLPFDGNFLRWFALVRIWTPWLAPRQGKTHLHLDKDAVVCSFLERSGGRHVVLLAISGVKDVTTVFQSDEAGNILIRNDRDSKGRSQVVAALGLHFESTLEAAVAYSRSVVDGDVQLGREIQKDLQGLSDAVQPQWRENWFDGLTYCTWNGLGQKLTESKVLDAMDTLTANKIYITNLIIDDNWQSLDYKGESQFQYGWEEFEADRHTFPNGLKHVVSTIRKRHPHIKHIAVWHAILGYWGGLSPDGKIARSYRTVQADRVDGKRRHLPLGGTMTVVAKEDVPKLYDDFYAFLSDCGIDAVKTDAQFMLDTLASAKVRSELYNTYIDAWAIATLKHFSVKAISCMSQTPQILFRSQLPTKQPAILVRNSDDFFPEIESSHPWHIWCNACNSLFTQHLNLLPDWDMFQTVHDYSGFHAAARCVSGGPIYFTDIPGRHNLALIKQMTALTTRGQTIILRPEIGKSLDPYVEYNDNVLLKVGTSCGSGPDRTSIIGVFNVSTRPLTELLPLSRFLYISDPSVLYVVRSHASGKISKSMSISNQHSGVSLIRVSLDIRGYDILSAFPLWEQGITQIANLGLLGKMTGAAAVLSSEYQSEGNSVTLKTTLKALGVLGLYISDLPSRPWKSRFLIMILGKVIPVHTVSVAQSSEKILQIDVEAAWNELKLNSGWSNEITLTIIIQ